MMLKMEKIIVHINQIQNPSKSPTYQFPLSIDIYEGANVTRKEIWVDQRKETYKFKVKQKPNLVNVDAKKIMLWEKNEDKSLDEWIFQFDNAPLYLDKLEAIYALDDKQDKTSGSRGIH